MAPPQLSDYETAANAIYQPQEAAEQEADQATDTTTKNTLEAEKPQIQTDYESAIDQLTNSVQNQTGQISQLYSERLGGNFSGLQGNAMQQLFTQANQQQSIISETEANKLSQITTEEGNADITYQADIAALTPKYQSLEEQYANSAYSSAVTDYNDTQYKDAELQLSEDRLGVEAESANNSAISAANSAADKYSVKQLSSGNLAYTGPNGSTNLYQYAQGVNGGASANPDDVLSTIQGELARGSTTDKGAAAGITKLKDQGESTSQILASLAKSNAYIFT